MSSKKKSRRPVPKQAPSASINPLLIIVGGVVLVAIAALVIFGAGGNTAGPQPTPEVTGAPKLKADQERVDLGNVRLGQPVSVNFELTNTGDQPLYFKEKPYVEVVEGC
ncbi:MAG TPA: hypothetical protein VJG32_20515 [Anaerolineae bacterium]|nr:hypothetical protein [Anaerolineae bacterium]